MEREPFLLDKATNVILTKEECHSSVRGVTNLQGRRSKSSKKNNSNHETNNFCSIIDRNV